MLIRFDFEVIKNANKILKDETSDSKGRTVK